MNITSYLFRKVCLLNIKIGKSGIERKQIASIRFLKGKALIENWRDFEDNALSKWKNSPVLVLVTGEEIVSKLYDKEDTNLKRIMEGSDFLWDIKVEEEKGETITFLRRNNLSAFLRIIEQQHLILIDTWIYGTNEECDIKTRLERLFLSQFASSTLMRASGFRAKLANLLYRKILLPVLLLFFVILLGNYFLNSYYTTQYQQINNNIRQNKKENRASSKEIQKIPGYNLIPNQSFALLADRIASYIPSNVYLTSMHIFPMKKKNDVRDKKELNLDYHIIRLTGTVETPGSVTLLSELLESDNLFKKVKVVQLSQKKNTTIFEFELEINL